MTSSLLKENKKNYLIEVLLENRSKKKTAGKYRKI